MITDAESCAVANEKLQNDVFDITKEQEKVTGSSKKLRSLNNLKGKLSQKGSLTVASSTLSILRVLIEESNWQSVQELMNLVKHEGKNLILQCGQTPTTSIIGNIIRRVLKLIREEASSSGEDEEAEASGEAAAEGS